MPRPIDPEKYETKRAAIVRAASVQFSTFGYRGSTTAGICGEAGISSGTFFHYFPTKLDALVAVLESGCEDLRIQLAQIDHGLAGLDATLRYAEAFELEIGQDGYAAFVAGLAGVESEPRVAKALNVEARLVLDFLTRHVETGQLRGEIRRDAPAPQLATWVSWLLDGAAQAAAVGPAALEPPALEPPELGPPEVGPAALGPSVLESGVRDGVRAILVENPAQRLGADR